MTVEAILQAHGYTSEWLEWGIVDEAYLRSQYAKYCESDDKNQEHYRFRGFLDYLNCQAHLTDEAIDRIFQLTDAGPDGCDLSTNRIIELIASGLLTDEQHFALADRFPIVRSPPIQRRYQRESLLRQIRRSGLHGSFAEVQASTDSAIHLYVLDHPDLSRLHLEWLGRCGANKSIRNRANAMLLSKRFRST